MNQKFKYQFTIALLAVAVFAQLFLNYSYKLQVSICLCIAFLAYSLYINHKIIRNLPRSSVAARRIRKRGSTFILLIFLMVLSIPFRSMDVNNWIFVFLLFSIALVEAISFVQYRRIKPETLFIIGDDIRLEDVRSESRDLTKLNSLTFNASTETISLHFWGQEPMHLVKTEFEEEGLRNILSHAVLKPRHTVWTDEQIRDLIQH